MDIWVTLAYRVLNSLRPLRLYPIYRGLRRFPSINGHWPSNPDTKCFRTFWNSFQAWIQENLAFALFGPVAPGGYAYSHNWPMT